MSVFEKKIQKLFADCHLEQYLESAVVGKFVEFWAVDRLSPATTTVSLRTLNQLAKILGTEDILVTGGNFEQDQRGELVHTKVLITAYGVKLAPRKSGS